MGDKSLYIVIRMSSNIGECNIGILLCLCLLILLRNCVLLYIHIYCDVRGRLGLIMVCNQNNFFTKEMPFHKLTENVSTENNDRIKNKSGFYWGLRLF